MICDDTSTADWDTLFPHRLENLEAKVTQQHISRRHQPQDPPAWRKIKPPHCKFTQMKGWEMPGVAHTPCVNIIVGSNSCRFVIPAHTLPPRETWHFKRYVLQKHNRRTGNSPQTNSSSTTIFAYGAGEWCSFGLTLTLLFSGTHSEIIHKRHSV